MLNRAVRRTRCAPFRSPRPRWPAVGLPEARQHRMFHSLVASGCSKQRWAKVHSRNRSRDRLRIFPATFRKGQGCFHRRPQDKPERACLHPCSPRWQCLPPEHTLDRSGGEIGLIHKSLRSTRPADCKELDGRYSIGKVRILIAEERLDRLRQIAAVHRRGGRSVHSNPVVAASTR